MSAKPAREADYGNPIPSGSIKKGEGRTDKWADYLVFRVHYGEEHIEEVELREDFGAWLGPPEPWSREAVIEAIHNHDRDPSAKGTFMTVDSGRLEKGRLEKGEEVLVVQLGDKLEDRYLRTHKSMDDLEDLERY